jgi:hypothetical protein
VRAGQIPSLAEQDAVAGEVGDEFQAAAEGLAGQGTDLRPGSSMSSGAKPIIDHWNGSAWSLHWNGSAWSIVPMPRNPGTNPNVGYAIGAIKANSPTDVWAVGSYTPTGGSATQTLTLNWNGNTWNTVASPNGSTGSSLLYSVAMTPGAAIVQAVGITGVYQAYNPLAMQNG